MGRDVFDAFAVEPHLAAVAQALEVLVTGERQPDGGAGGRGVLVDLGHASVLSRWRRYVREYITESRAA